jgi:hypothetical protein
MACPCDAGKQACETNCTNTMSADCMMVIMDVASCTMTAACTQPVCPATTGG